MTAVDDIWLSLASEPHCLVGWLSLRVLLSRKQKFSFSCKNQSLVSQMVKNLPAVEETQVLSLGQEDPLEK